MADTIPCPQCGAGPGSASGSGSDSTAGPVEHVQIGCVNNHWLTPPAETVAGARSEPTPAAVEAVPA
jgi:hypothetical protein